MCGRIRFEAALPTAEAINANRAEIAKLGLLAANVKNVQANAWLPWPLWGNSKEVLVVTSLGHRISERENDNDNA